MNCLILFFFLLLHLCRKEIWLWNFWAYSYFWSWIQEKIVVPKELDSDSVEEEGEDDEEEEGKNVEAAHELLARIKESMEQNAGRKYEVLRWDLGN